MEQYNLEYSVACIQFINIIVHSPENINLRVYLQYGFQLLGLEDFLTTLQSAPGDKGNRHVDAYMTNRVNCSLLLDDAEAKEAAMDEVSRLEAALEASETSARQAAASFKQRDLALSELVESLRGKIRDINVATGLQETANKRIQELEFSLSAAHRQIQRLQVALENVQSSSSAMALADSQSTYIGKKKSVCNMTTSTTLPMGFEFSSPSSTSGDRLSGGSGSHSPSSHKKGKSMRSASADLLSSREADEKPNYHYDSPSKTSPQFGTFSRHTTSVAEKPRCGLISCTLISQVKDFATARKIFANVSSVLYTMASRLSRSPPLLFQSPLSPLPHWHAAIPFETSITTTNPNPVAASSGSESSPSYAETDNSDIAQRGPLDLSSFSPDLSTLAAALPDPWGTCLASADRLLKSPRSTSHPPTQSETTLETRILTWLQNSGLIDESLAAGCRQEHEILQTDASITLGNMPFVSSLLSANLSPFISTRILSVLESMSNQQLLTGAQNYNVPQTNKQLLVLFSVAERILKEAANSEALLSSPLLAKSSSNWPLLQAFLRVNLLPFVFLRNMELLIEQLTVLSSCCNAIIANKKLPIVIQITEELIGVLLAKPDFPALELSNLSSLVDWSLISRKSTAVDAIDSPRLLKRGSLNGAPTGSVQRMKPFMESLIKVVEMKSPELFDWTSEILHLDASAHILPSDIRDRIRELEYDLALRDTLFVSESPGFLQYLPSDAPDELCDLKTVLADVETLMGAAAFRLYSTTGSKGLLRFSSTKPEAHDTFSDRDFSQELASLARFSAVFKKFASDHERRKRSHAKSSKSSSSKRNGQHKGHDAAGVKNGQDKHESSGRKRHGTRHLDTHGIMDNILAGIEPEPLYADIHKPQSKPDV
uniref:Formin FH3 domain-containing protein n=3 Tax=Schistocephalus solidus TaxID=70667 RepID=A0A0X3P9F9_SCHSO